MSSKFLLTLFVLLILSYLAPAQDYGPVLSTCIDVAPGKLKDTTKLADTKNYVFRGKVISLGKDRRVSLCFDTEMMRVAGAWVGTPMKFSADKNMGPPVEGKMLFSTKPGPGWAKDGKWDDPRLGKEGPLPRDWAHYRGYYVHGDQVVLSYTVGNMSVLEMPGCVETEGGPIITRTFNVGPSTKPTKVLICEEAAPIKEREASKCGVWIPYTFEVARLTGKEWEINAVVVGHLPDAKYQRGSPYEPGGNFEIDKQRLYLHLPILPKGGRCKVFLCKSPRATDWKNMDKLTDKATKEAEQKHAFDLSSYVKGGPPHWNQPLETTGFRDTTSKHAYVLDQIPLPENNPWKASIRCSGLDFFPDGRAALCTWDGDVWIVSGFDDKLDKVRWKRFASGLQMPLGLKIINGIIYTAGRDQITKLHDLNNDGEADFYENFNNDPGLTLQRHEFVMDLQTDPQGNLYYCRSGHYLQSKRGDNCCVYKLSPNGKILEKFARGFREPNGLSIGPDGTMTVADNEGNGIPQTPIYRLKRGADYGFTPSTTGNPNQGSWTEREKPIVWLGPKVDQSAGGQVWVTSDQWGPLKGHLLHTSYGNCALFSVLIDKQAEPWQGAVWKFPLPFNSGIMRARFHPIDGQLYACGLRGWGTSAVKDGQFCRIRYTGKTTPIPVGYRVVKDGIELTFSSPLDKKATEDDENWAGNWTSILKKVPNAKEKQEMPISAVKLANDRKTVTIALEKIHPVPNFDLQYRIQAADGSGLSGELHGTIHRVP